MKAVIHRFAADYCSARHHWFLLLCCGWWLSSPGVAQDLETARQLYRDGQWHQAAEAFAAAATNSTAEPEDRARAFNNACVVWNDLGDHRRAASACRQALALRRTIDDPQRLARTLNNLGLSERYLGNLEAGRQAFDEALTLNRQLGEVAQEVVNLANLGALETEAGSFGAALRHHRAAEQLATENLAEPWAGEQVWISRVNQGVALELAGAYRPALELYRQALVDEHLVSPRRRATLRVNLGVVYRNLGDPQQAVEAFAAAAERYQQLGDGSGRANALLNLGLAYHLNLARPQAAEEALTAALEAARLGGVKAEELRSLDQLGHLHLDQGRYREAEQTFRQQLALAEASDTAPARWRAESGIGQVFAARGELDQALPYLLRAIAGLETQHSTFGEPAQSDLRWTFLDDNRSIFGAAIEVLADLDAALPATDATDESSFAEQALTIVQQAKARELLEALGQQGGAASAPRTAADLLARAGDDLVLEYFTTESRLLLWEIGSDAIELHDLGPPDPVRRGVTEVHRALAAGASPSAETLESLSQLLLGPVTGGPTSSGILRIAPDGLLHYLPFELLTAAGADQRPLIERWPLTYLASASALGERPLARSGRLLGLGNLQLEPLAERPSTPRELLIERFHLAPLPAAADELRRIAELWPDDYQLAFADQATEGNFQALLAEPVGVLHLATHAVLDERPGGGALIVLGTDAHHDGLLHPKEIAALDLSVGLTVLSACRTAIQDEQGRALSSLSGAFLAAGSAAVLATLWDVDDHASAVFMEQFYYFLGRGSAPAEALRRAKLRLRADPDWDRPSVWAAYVLSGDAGPLVEPRRGPWLLGGSLLIALAAAGLWTWWRRPRRPRTHPPGRGQNV